MKLDIIEIILLGSLHGHMLSVLVVVSLFYIGEKTDKTLTASSDRKAPLRWRGSNLGHCEVMREVHTTAFSGFPAPSSPCTRHCLAKCCHTSIVKHNDPNLHTLTKVPIFVQCVGPKSSALSGGGCVSMRVL